MVTVRKAITIHAPVARVYEFVTHPENLPEVWPSLVEVKNVERWPDGAHHFDWIYKMAGVRFRGHTDTIAVEQNHHMVDRTEQGIPNTFDWTCTPAGDDTVVALQVSYELPGVFERLARPFLVKRNEREAETLLANLKTRLDHAAG